MRLSTVWTTVQVSLLMCVALGAAEVPPVDVEPLWDVNGDGDLNLDDTTAFQMTLWLNDPEYYDARLDFNPDGELDYLDLIALIHHADRDVGDLDWDGDTDYSDTGYFSIFYGLPVPPYFMYGQGDVNCDGKVDSSDLVIIGQFNDEFVFDLLPNMTPQMWSEVPIELLLDAAVE